MGMVLKVIGGLTIFGWIVMAVGCTMLTHAIGQAGGPMSAQAAGARDDVVRAMQDGGIDTVDMPSASELRSHDRVTVRLRDGSTRTLGDSAGERPVRDLLAQRSEASSDPWSGSAYAPRASSSRNGGTAAQPHFKPGEPMVNPGPGSSYDD